MKDSFHDTAVGASDHHLLRSTGGAPMPGGGRAATFCGLLAAGCKGRDQALGCLPLDGGAVGGGLYRGRKSNMTVSTFGMRE